MISPRSRPDGSICWFSRRTSLRAAETVSCQVYPPSREIATAMLETRSASCSGPTANSSTPIEIMV